MPRLVGSYEYISQAMPVSLGPGTRRNLLELGNELSLEHSELYVFLIYVENNSYCSSVVTQLQNYFCTTPNLRNNSAASSQQPPSSRFGDTIHFFPMKALLQPGNRLRHGPQSGHHFVRVYSRTLTIGICSSPLTCREVMLIFRSPFRSVKFHSFPW
jgi:hypothetical protein